MKVLKREPMLWRLRVETEDDLWTLARLARKGMDLAMLGERRDQTTGGEEEEEPRPQRGKKCGFVFPLNLQNINHIVKC